MYSFSAKKHLSISNISSIIRCVFIKKGFWQMTKKISFGAMKGGTGKTTIAYNIACKLAIKYKVLVIDFDAQCNISANFCFDIFNEESMSVANIFEDINTDPLKVLITSPLEELPNLDLFPSTIYLNGTEMNLHSRPMRELIMDNYIKKNWQFFSFYDYIIFDTGPNMGIINQNAFFISDSIVLCIDPDCNSARGADTYIKLWNDALEYAFRYENRINGLIINNVERTKISKKFETYINEHSVLSKIKFRHTLPHTTRFKECAEQNKPVFLLETSSKAEKRSKDKADCAIELLIMEMQERSVL